MCGLLIDYLEIGNYFGSAALSQSYAGVVNATLVNGANVGTLTFALINCTIISSTHIRCILPLFVGTNHAISLSVAGQHAAINTAAGATISYDAPTITRVTTSPQLMTTDGGATIIITGMYSMPSRVHLRLRLHGRVRVNDHHAPRRY